jgi:hypothetical protein
VQGRRDLGWSLASHLKEMFDLGADVDNEGDMARRDRYYMGDHWFGPPRCVGQGIDSAVLAIGAGAAFSALARRPRLFSRQAACSRRWVTHVVDGL